MGGNPTWPAIVQLVRVLGARLVALGFEEVPTVELRRRNGIAQKPNKPR